MLVRLVSAGLKINREKCEFCCSRVTYLGFLLDEEGLRPDPEKVAPVMEYNLKELRRFLGIMGWYSRFIARENTVSEKELLAVVWSIENLRSYLEGYHFTVIADHSA